MLVLADCGRSCATPVTILLESTPAGIDAVELGRRMASEPGRREVHDLHVWTITSGFPALSAHVLVRRGDDYARRRELEQVLARDYGIEHTTLQVDHAGEPGTVAVESLRGQSR